MYCYTVNLGRGQKLHITVASLLSVSLSESELCEPAHGERQLSTDDVRHEEMTRRVQVILDVVS